MNAILKASVLLLLLGCSRGASDQRRSDASTPASDAEAAAPDTFTVAVQTSRGPIVLRVVRAWAPLGADRFYQLVNEHFYDGAKFFRVLGFMAQFGISGDPETNERWHDRTIADDSVTQSNQRGFVSFAMAGPHTRTTQLFINKRDNARLDAMGFAPFARVVQGMEVVDSLYAGYGEGAPQGDGPSQDRIEREGNEYLNRYFPRLDSIVSARVVR